MIVYCMFDGSGIMGLPWAEAGHKVYCFNYDEANHGTYEIKMQHDNLHYVNVWIDSSFNTFLMQSKIPAPEIIFAFPDCTFFAQSGSQHERAPGDIETALASARLVELLGRRYGCPWMVENPVGKLSTLWRKPDHYFNPHEYGGYMSATDRPFHPKMPEYDGYTKKTAIWCGNGFVMPERKPGPVNIGCFWGWKYLGGASARTKQLRSLTPRGFARAVFLFNNK